MSEMPPGWEWTTIGDLLAPLSDGKTIHQGWSPRCEKHPSSDESTWGVLKTTAIQPGEFRSEHNKELPSSLEPRPGIEVVAGDILLTCAGPRARCGVACLVRSTRGRLMMSGKMYRLRVNERYVLPAYLEAYLQTTQAWLAIDQMKTGGSDSGLNLTQARFRELAVPLAPRPEQERIVTAVEEHLSRLDAAVVALSSGRRRLANLGQRLVDAAIEGDPVPLEDLLREPLRNGLSASAAATGSIRVVTLTAVTQASFVEEHTKLIEAPARPVDDLWMQDGDVFIQRSNTPELVGTAALYGGQPNWAIFPDLLIRVRVDTRRVEPSYLALVLGSTALRRYFQHSAQGIAGSMPKISQPVVEAAQIPLPTLDRQHELLHRIESDRAVLARTADELSRSERRLASLRRSVLSAAFSGRLVPQDPNDEPASTLLDRITSERAAAAPPKRTRKVKAS